ncbi:inositol monophosphatase [Paucibacter sp. KBW04]|uniref:inositol monophosphatase family protein n=1 Tax=Paucibacter sp. KBW04 TaxID=2153361 RepID=UPI000F5773AC|nr:inositol monophosphatase family protein [Paucibacter sp. KBW04]RQO58759.1 inositol monophosphatase [Paucibacter sp. KBW04]
MSTTLDHSTLIKTALEAVLAGAKLAETAAANAQSAQQKESLRDIVTQTDLRISELLMQRLAATGLPVVSEEAEAHAAVAAKQLWVVDPIDGTVNFAHGLAAYAVCAGLVDQGEFRLGVVCAPKLDELYFTLNTEKALLNGRPFVHSHRAPDEALVAASFSAKASAAQYEMFQAVNDSTRGCLRTGSAALNVCWAAAGKLQAAYGFSAKLWDVAGALAIARAAGCELRLHRHADGLSVDYIVGSREVVEHLARLAQDKQLWKR